MVVQQCYRNNDGESVISDCPFSHSPGPFLLLFSIKGRNSDDEFQNPTEISPNSTLY